jgi:hypothetical protein
MPEQSYSYDRLKEEVPEPLRTVLVGLARVLAKHEADFSGGPGGTKRGNYGDIFNRRRRKVYEVLRWLVEKESDDKRYIRLAAASVLAGKEPRDLLMAVVVRERTADGGDRSPINEPITVLRRGDRLFWLIAPAGEVLGIEVVKAPPATSTPS